MLPKLYFFVQKALSCLPLVFLCCWPSTSRVPYRTPIRQEQFNFVCLLAVECSESFQVQDLSVWAGGWRLNIFISLLITTMLIVSFLAEIIPLHQRGFVENDNANQHLYTTSVALDQFYGPKFLDPNCLDPNFLDLNFLDPNILKQFIGPIFPTQIFWTRNFWSQIFWTRIFGPEFFGPELFEPIFWINLLDIHIPSP